MSFHDFFPKLPYKVCSIVVFLKKNSFCCQTSSFSGKKTLKKWKIDFLCNFAPFLDILSSNGRILLFFP